MKINFGRSATPCIGRKEANTGRDVHVRGAARASPEKMAAHARRRHPRSRRSKICVSASRRARGSERVSWNISRCGHTALPRFNRPRQREQKTVSNLGTPRFALFAGIQSIFVRENNIIFFIGVHIGQNAPRVRHNFFDFCLSRERGNFVGTVNALEASRSDFSPI